MYLVILAFDNLNFRQWAVRYKAIRHIFLSLREDPPKIYAYVPILDNNVIHGLRPLKSYSETDREIFS